MTPPATIDVAAPTREGLWLDEQGELAHKMLEAETEYKASAAATKDLKDKWDKCKTDLIAHVLKVSRVRSGAERELPLFDGTESAVVLAPGRQALVDELGKLFIDVTPAEAAAWTDDQIIELDAFLQTKGGVLPTFLQDRDADGGAPTEAAASETSDETADEEASAGALL